MVPPRHYIVKPVGERFKKFSEVKVAWRRAGKRSEKEVTRRKRMRRIREEAVRRNEIATRVLIYPIWLRGGSFCFAFNIKGTNIVSITC